MLGKISVSGGGVGREGGGYSEFWLSPSIKKYPVYQPYPKKMSACGIKAFPVRSTFGPIFWSRLFLRRMQLPDHARSNTCNLS